MKKQQLLLIFILFSTFAYSAKAATVLNYYVNFVDEFFSWNESMSTSHLRYDVYNILMRSQLWLTHGEVDKPEWYHWVQVCVPHDYVYGSYDLAFMYINGGGNPLDYNSPPSDIDEVVSKLAVATNTIGVALHQIPNQPIYFKGAMNPNRGRSEDSMIAYTWSHWVNNTFEYDWIAQFPMTKATIKAMDAVQQWVETQTRVSAVNRFVVGGGSKRGWTTWLAGGMGDPRIVGIAPIVAPIANLVPQINEMWQSYGGWSFALQDYVDMNLMGWLNLPRFDDLLNLIDPIFYDGALSKIPKYVIVASGDEFFMPDAAQYYWSQLSGPKYLRIVPNAEHSLAGHIFNVLNGIEQMYLTLLNNEQSNLPEYNWEISEDGSTITVTTLQVDNLIEARAWISQNNTNRDWRLLTCGEVSCVNLALWRSETLTAISPGVYSFTLEIPTDNTYSAFFIELDYNYYNDGGDVKYMQVTSDMSILPYHQYPFPPCPDDVCKCGYKCARNYYDG